MNVYSYVYMSVLSPVTNTHFLNMWILLMALYTSYLCGIEGSYNLGESQGQFLLSMGAMVCNKVTKAPCLNLTWWGAQHADFKIFASVTCVLNFHNQKLPTSVCHVIPYGEVTKQTDRERNVPSVLYDSKFGVVICSSSDNICTYDSDYTYSISAPSHKQMMPLSWLRTLSPTYK